MNRKRARLDKTPPPPEEPSFEEFCAARRVIVWVRRWLEEAGEHISLSEDAIFSQVVMRSSPLADPALFEESQLLSAEGRYERSFYDAAAMRRESGQ